MKEYRFNRFIFEVAQCAATAFGVVAAAINCDSFFLDGAAQLMISRVFS